ncbi:hypothetical protein [Listeria booriae]|uniref:hypothetical protein n=1 Tax=Listeria booriae TaxID=1552123 RepID=UPI00164D49FB|nr:hypothetical protein [Listeria booriae]MBC6300329.1 hypothetical protein [Listeria booriae]
MTTVDDIKNGDTVQTIHETGALGGKLIPAQVKCKVINVGEHFIKVSSPFNTIKTWVIPITSVRLIERANQKETKGGE